MLRRYALPLILVFLVACGATARERTLRATLTAAQAAQAGFVAWDAAHQHELVLAATSRADGAEKLAAYRDQRQPVLTALEVTYRSIATAALLDKDDHKLADVLYAAEQLRLSIKAVTGKDFAP